jgi:hypothetical protein
VIILHKKKVIYCGIPKVACSSFKLICADILFPKRDRSKHVHGQINFPKISIEDIGQYKDYFKFCFVRNPWDKTVSLYRDKILNEASGNDPYFGKIRPGISDVLARFDCFESGMSFESFVYAIYSIPDQEADIHFQSQYTFITDQDREFFVDFIGRFEKLGEDYQKICEITGMPEVQLPHLKRTSPLDYRTLYNENTKQLVAKRYKEDIELFQFAF